MRPHLFGSSGIRRLADQTLVDLAYNVGFAAGGKYRRVCLGGDTRSSTPLIKSALFKGLRMSGASCLDAGMIPTPTLAYVSRHFDMGFMVTASHNPPEYNGIKLWNPDGAAFDDAQEAWIESAVEDALSRFPDGDSAIPAYPGAVSEHTSRILAGFNGSLDKLKVLVDCGGGAASAITPQLLQAMGADVDSLYCRPMPIFPRPSEPTDESLSELKRRVVETGARIGLAHDGDADRLVVVNERGVLISGDALLIILARYLGVNEVVTTVDASMIIEESGLKVTRTRVGDSAVSAELKRIGGAFGGEPCGAWIFPQVSYCPDGIHAAAIVAMLAADGRLSQLAAEIPSYPMIRGSISFTSRPDMAAIEAGLLGLAHQGVDRTDGLKLRLNTGWILVRKSGTEPKIRLTVEARSETEAKRIYNMACELIKSHSSDTAQWSPNVSPED